MAIRLIGGGPTITTIRLILLQALLCGLAGSPAAAQNLSSPFCVVAVRDGTPTEKDVNEAWRMVSKVITLPGVPRPIIYAYNRGGVWTIDENPAFVRFGGEFPSNPLHDKIAHDPDSGRFVGINNTLGIFALDPGQSQFKKLHGLGNGLLQHPYSVEFVPRFKGFVVSDASGLYFLDRAGSLSPLSIGDRTTLRVPFHVFDLPSFNALVINAQNSSAVIRYDDGEVVRVATFDRRDYVLRVTVQADGSVSLHGNKKSKVVRLRRTPVGPIVQGRSYVIEETRPRKSLTRLDAPSIGKTVVMDSKSGLTELGLSGQIPISLPFDPADEPITSIVELPEYRAVFIQTSASGYALGDNGTITEIPGAREIGVSRLGAIVRLIPIRNETIFLGRNSLNLLLDRRISGEAACIAGP
jgi:hypothetical protein